MRLARAILGGIPTLVDVDGDLLHPLADDNLPAPTRGSETYSSPGGGLEPPLPLRRCFAILGGFFDDGAERTGRSERGDPVLVPKSVSQVSGDGGRITYPAFATSVVIEAEMALVIGHRLNGATPDEAASGILGYTCFNDVTAPQYFPQYWLAKSLPTFASMGPWVTTGLSERDIDDGLRIEARINGAVVQAGTTARYRFRPSEVVSYLSSILTLTPGDVITLGTPPPPAEVQPGDVVEIEVEGIGVLRNQIVPPATSPSPGKEARTRRGIGSGSSDRIQRVGLIPSDRNGERML